MSLRVGPASFWFGSDLSFIEVACLKSFVNVGQPFVLYTYGNVGNIPEGVTVKDASEILPESAVFKNKERESYAPFSDYFRYKMLQQTPYFWVDTDAMALAPFPTDEPYFFAPHNHIINNAILALPPDCPVLDDLIEACERPHAALPWLRRPARERLQSMGDQFDASDLPYKALGPLALSWLLEHYGLREKATPQPVLYPYEPRHIMAPNRRMERKLPSQAISIHLYSSAVRRKLTNAGIGVPPEGTFLHHLCVAQGVSPANYPFLVPSKATDQVTKVA